MSEIVEELTARIELKEGDNLPTGVNLRLMTAAREALVHCAGRYCPSTHFERRCAMNSYSRPANYTSLTGTAQAIIDDHIRAGVEPPKFTPFVPQPPGPPINIDDLPED